MMVRLTYKLAFVILAALLLINTGCTKNERVAGRSQNRQEVIAKMKPYDGPSVSGVDTTTLTGKVMCGYQGAFICPQDGSELGWSGWGKNGKFDANNCGVDFWPDMNDYDKDEKYPTAFRYADGSTAYVFSSMNKKTVLRHFKWMSDYGIDGVFVQRLAPQIDTEKELILCNHTWWLATAARTWRPFDATTLNFRNTVLANCREGANQYGRAYAVMYDLSGLKAGQINSVIDDWKLLVDKMKLTKDARDKAYLRHNGKPVVAVWGIGFNDNHEYSLDECAKLVDFLKNDPDYGGCTVVLGVPTWWRTHYNDCVDDKKVVEIALAADIISPWTVGRFSKVDDVPGFARNIWDEDNEWCKKNNKEYMPVVWPGFSWHNMFPKRRLNQFPRLKGQLLWEQYAEAKKAGATMIYQASFDDLGEGDAIFKCTGTPPAGETKFLTYEDLESDYYLWLTGQAWKMMRGQIELTEQLPERNR
jgi:hypothetical protein